MAVPVMRAVDRTEEPSTRHRRIAARLAPESLFMVCILVNCSRINKGLVKMRISTRFGVWLMRPLYSAPRASSFNLFWMNGAGPRAYWP